MKYTEKVFDLYFWSYKFRFERIYVKPHIEAIKCIYEKIVKGNKDFIKILQLLKDDGNYGNCFFLESRCYDWSKSCRIFCLFNILSKEIYPLFIDVNHICCYSYDDKKVKRHENFLKNDDNFL